MWGTMGYEQVGLRQVLDWNPWLGAMLHSRPAFHITLLCVALALLIPPEHVGNPMKWPHCSGGLRTSIIASAQRVNHSPQPRTKRW